MMREYAIAIFGCICFFSNWGLAQKAPGVLTVSVTAPAGYTDTLFLEWRPSTFITSLEEEKRIVYAMPDNKGRFFLRIKDDTDQGGRYSIFRNKDPGQASEEGFGRQRDYLFFNRLFFHGEHVVVEITANDKCPELKIGGAYQQVQSAIDFTLQRGVDSPAIGKFRTFIAPDIYGKYGFEMIRTANARLTVLQEHKRSLSSGLYYNLFAETKFGNIYAILKYLLNIFTRNPNGTLTDSRKFLEFCGSYRMDTIPEEALAENTYYWGSLLYETAIRSFIGDVNSVAEGFLKNICTSFKGEARDKLIALYMKNFGIKRGEMTFYDSVVKTIKDPRIKRYMDERTKFLPGTAARNFEFSDENGRLRSLSEFSGKKIVMDYWFVPCGACAILNATVMKPLEELLKSDTSVVFITVSIDKDYNVWKKALRSGKYTTEYSVNLITNGLGEKHEVAEFYQISACPFVMVIDEYGKIISVNTPETKKYNTLLRMLEKD